MPKSEIEATVEINESVDSFEQASAPPDKSVSKLAKEGVFYNVIVRLGNTFTQFLGGLVLVRLLEPSDFGIMQICWLIIGFATKFGEFGFNMGLIQRNKPVRPEHVNTLFILDLSFKVGLWVIILVLTPVLTRFFHEPKLAIVLPVFTFYMVVECFSTSPNTILQRSMNFKAFSQVMAIDRNVQMITAIIFAALGFGVWSLVLGEFCGEIISALRAIQITGWRPRLQYDREARKELFGYGTWVFLRNLFRYFSDNVDYLIIGRVLDAQQLGFYAKAFELMKLPRRRITRALNVVVFPAFAKVQNQPEKIKNGFEKLVLSVSLVAYPIQVGMLMAAPAFVHVAMGAKWAPSIACLQIMCVAGILRSLDPFLNSVITTSGFVRYSAFRRALEFVILAIAVFIGVRWGINGVSAAVTISSIIVMVLMVNLLRRVSLIGWRAYFAPQWPAMVSSAAMALAMWGVNFTLGGRIGPHSLPMLILLTVVGSAVYVGVLLVWRPKRVVALYCELSGDAKSVVAKARKKIARLIQHFGMKETK
ncbi:MAG: lipopolysaccharide biosynthesis protein [candidate division KSB1 bacterium]|nr:lipopolysaccharide biosynthesis protein [candidate division KSB1 bacterium]MDZ7302279.1 lipopolysaccharide biosynthesis protein [candidate division KSB1 bacterium]MDZ7311385.1 lipopolysaccharide biosynthesis protein [candidate division KSB1 bacterium]